MNMLKLFVFGLLIMQILTSGALAKEHPGNAEIAKSGYKGPETCEMCHKGVVKEFMQTVHWKHASKVKNVENTDPTKEYGMMNRVYTMCNGNELVNNLKQVVNAEGKTKFTGCESCHPGDGINKPWSTGPAAEASIDCLLCHSTAYNYSKRKPYVDEQGKVRMGQDRSTEAALAIGKPTAKNCNICHESGGGGQYYKRGVSFDAEHDVHAAKGMTCADCHAAKKHRFPSGNDPNVWASDGVSISCADASCHGNKPHKLKAYNDHTARIACQTCHVLGSGGAYIKDFTNWIKNESGFYEYVVLTKEPGQLPPTYTWYNGNVANNDYFIGPKGSRKDAKSLITPFKVFYGRGYYNKKTGKLLLMDFGPPLGKGDVKAGIASAAKTLGIKNYELTPGWQTQYFKTNHMVQKTGLTCERCHDPNGVLNFHALGYTSKEIKKLTSPQLYFDIMYNQAREKW